MDVYRLMGAEPYPVARAGDVVLASERGSPGTFAEALTEFSIAVGTGNADAPVSPYVADCDPMGADVQYPHSI